MGKFFDIDKWKKAVKPEEWARVVYVLNRGGRYEAQGNEYDGPYLKYKMAGQADFYSEKVAKGKHAFTGEPFDGLPRIEEIAYFNGKKVDTGYPLWLINWKARHIGIHRTISDSWLREIVPENYVWMNPVDAKQRGLDDGDSIKITSRDFEVMGKVRVTNGIKPGVVGCSMNYGHFSSGSSPVIIDGKKIEAVKPYGHTKWEAGVEETGIALGRGTGFAVNHLHDVDVALKIGCLSDPIGGGSCPNDAWVEIVKA